ncbi:MAG TPA: hypothetical protein VFQ41_23940 [Candidatus Angelobacter sp.]|nr:hypothetical protein [Candidatus Angelobacter sp.]
MPSSLADPYLKTARAKEHLDELRERLTKFREEQPISFDREDNLVNQQHIVRIKIKGIPDKITLIAGDFLYCLRSSLDQLVWALAKNVGAYPSGTQFPILEQPDQGKFKRNTFGVPPEAAKLIESYQPYNAQNTALIKEHLLWQLNKLCNIDKHRRIPTDATIVDFQFPDFPKKFISRAKFDPDSETVTMPLELKEYAKLNPTAYLNVTFGDSHEGIRCDVARLVQMYEFVSHKVIPGFATFF